jgi:hypothetical protein
MPSYTSPAPYDFYLPDYDQSLISGGEWYTGMTNNWTKLAALLQHKASLNASSPETGYINVTGAGTFGGAVTCASLSATGNVSGGTGNFAGNVGVGGTLSGVGASFSGPLTAAGVTVSGGQQFSATGDAVIAGSASIGTGLAPSGTHLDVAGSARLRNGNSAGSTSANQLLFGWNLGLLYQHAIKTQHNSGAATGNIIDFYLWTPTDAAGTVGSLRAISFRGDHVIDIPSGWDIQIGGVSLDTSHVAHVNTSNTFTAAPQTIDLASGFAEWRARSTGNAYGRF